MKGNKKGVVLMIVISTAALLALIVQQMSFDTHVEFQSGAGRFQALKAYHAARSGVKLALLRLMLYKKIIGYVQKEKNSPQKKAVLSQIEPELNFIWNQPLRWPPAADPDDSPFKKEEIQSIKEESLLNANISFETFILNEGAKLNLSYLGFPDISVREWTQSVLLNLLFNLRQKHSWVAENYSENDLQDITERVASLFDLSSSFSDGYYPKKGALMDLDDLLSIDKMQPELAEFLSPYVTLFGEGLSLSLADPLLLASLHENLREQDFEEAFKEEPQEQVFATKDQTKTFFQNRGLHFMIDSYFNEKADEIDLSDLVFNFDAPQNFRIISRARIGGAERGITAVFYDPLLILRQSRQLSLRKIQRIKKPLSPKRFKELEPYTPKYRVSPFLILWKDIN